MQPGETGTAPAGAAASDPGFEIYRELGEESALLSLIWTHGITATLDHLKSRVDALLKHVDIHDPAQCLALFKFNGVVGLIIFAGLVLAILVRLI